MDYSYTQHVESRRHVKLKRPDPKEDGVLLFSHKVVSNSFEIPWTVTCQASLPMGFPRQEYRSGFPFPFPRDHLHPGIKPASPALADEFFTTYDVGFSEDSLIFEEENLALGPGTRLNHSRAFV